MSPLECPTCTISALCCPLLAAMTPPWPVHLLTLARSFSQPWYERMLKWNRFTLESAQARDNRCVETRREALLSPPPGKSGQ